MAFCRTDRKHPDSRAENPGALIVKGIAFIGVDDLGVPVGGQPWDVLAVGHVNVSVDKVAGLVFVHQAVEGVEAGVTQVLAVVEAQSGGVGEQDVKPALAEQVQPASAYPPVHPPLCL